MTNSGIWKRRARRLYDAGARWLDLRLADLQWMYDGRRFRQSLPQLLRDRRFVFVVGCNNSGTTLIHDVLAATGNFSYMPHEGQRYTRALRPAAKRGHERVWTEYLDELRMDESHSTGVMPRLVFDWLRHLSRPLQPLILEKTPANAVRMRWLQKAFPDAAFIGVIRNGFAVVEGIQRKGHKSAERAALHWSRVNELMLEDAQQLRHFMLIQYEEFVTAPQEVLPRLAEFLGLSAADLFSGWRHIDRNPTASSRTSIRDMNALSLQRLNPDDQRVISQFAGGLLHRFGYLQQT